MRDLKRERHMLRLYRRGYVLDDIGERYGISRERVRQLRNRIARDIGPDAGREATEANRAYQAAWKLVARVAAREIEEAIQRGRRCGGCGEGLAWAHGHAKSCRWCGLYSHMRNLVHKRREAGRPGGWRAVCPDCGGVYRARTFALRCRECAWKHSTWMALVARITRNRAIGETEEQELRASFGAWKERRWPSTRDELNKEDDQ